MIDAAPPPKLWTPPKPAIIRARGDALYRLAPEGKRAVFPIPFFCPSSKPLAIAAYNTSNVASNSTSHTVSLPAGISVGDGLLIFATVTNATDYPSAPGGWSNLAFLGLSDMPGRNLSVFYRVADGSEGATVTLTTSSGRVSAHVTMRIAGADPGTPPEAAITSGSSSTTPDPPSLTPSWGAKRSVWIAVAGNAGAVITQSAQPSGYGNPQTSSANGSTAGTRVNTFTADKIDTVSSDDPSTFTVSASATWLAATVAVKGA